MRQPSNSSREELSFNMTPMIDVVFLLIIFFLVASHLAKQDVKLALDLPVASTSEPDKEEEKSNRLIVNVLASKSAGTAVQVGGVTKNPTQLQKLITQKRSEMGDMLEVRIRCDQNTTYENVKPVMIAAVKAGVWNVTFAVEEKRKKK